MSNPQIKVFVGVDMAKGEHLAQAITTNGLSSFHTDGFKGVEQGETRRLWFMVSLSW